MNEEQLTPSLTIRRRLHRDRQAGYRHVNGKIYILMLIPLSENPFFIPYLDVFYLFLSCKDETVPEMTTRPKA